jgi:hypothetical protein
MLARLSTCSRTSRLDTTGQGPVTNCLEGAALLSGEWLVWADWSREPAARRCCPGSLVSALGVSHGLAQQRVEAAGSVSRLR